MAKIKWDGKEIKDVLINQPGAKASLRFVPGQMIVIDDALEIAIRKKLSDDISCGRLVFIPEGKTTSDTKYKKG